MHKQKLSIKNDYNFLLFGISCSEKPPRLCYALNHKLKAVFSKSKDIEVAEENQSNLLKFPVFSFCNEEMFTDYRIIVNRNKNRFLVSDYKQADYLLMVQGELPHSEKSFILRKIKEIGFVQTVFEMDVKKIRGKENLLF